MKKLGLLTGTLVGMLTVTTHNLTADTYFSPLPTENLNVTLTALIQGETRDIVRGKGADRQVIGEEQRGPTKVKINNKAILKMLNAPSGARLVLMDGNSVGLEIGKNPPVETGYTLALDAGPVVIVSGQETDVDTSNANHESSAQKSNHQARYVAMAVVNPGVAANGLVIGLTGPAVENASRSETRKDDLTKIGANHSFVMEGAGEGAILTAEDEELDALFSGSVKCSGKDAASF